MNAPPNEMGAAPGTATAPHDSSPTKDTDSSSTVAEAIAALPPEVLAVLVDLMPDPAAEVELRRRLVNEAYLDGCRHGWKLGLEHGARIRQADWPAFVAALPRPDLAELELLRWGPGGRERFADRRPGDYIPPTRLEAAS